MAACCIGAANYSLSEISKSDIQIAAKLAGLEFTDSEVDLMMEDVKEGLNAIHANRKYKLNNSEMPVNIFTPVLPGFQFDEGQEELQYSVPKKVKKPKNINELAWYSIPELAYLIRKKKISSVELTHFFINRLKKHNDTLQCVITFTEELAIKQARKADKEIAEGNYRGLLHGIPYGAKDLLAVKGYKTTWGATTYKDQVIDHNARVIEMLEEAGAVLVAKTSLGALAWGDVWYGGTTKNPWDTSQGSSGSSAGSASAVSAGLLPFAIGSETYGSIVSPSTVCGTTGLRPTFGRVSRDGAMTLCWSLDKLGPITRSAQDAMIVLEAMSGPDPDDPFTVDLPLNYNHKLDIKKLRIGYLKSTFESDYPFKKQDSIALIEFEKLGIDLIPVKLPDFPNIMSAVLGAEAAAAFDDFTVNNLDDDLVRQTRYAWPNFFRVGRLVPAVEYIKANRLRRGLMENMAKLFSDVDAIIHPSWFGNALPLTNLTGHPCIVIPNGFSAEGTPTSITIMGALFKEGEIVALARTYQKATKWDEMHPEKFID